MSKKNITEQKTVGKDIHVTFDTDKGPVTYKYSGSSARALKRGTDPSQLLGKRVDKKD
jgi:hypothetical protein